MVDGGQDATIEEPQVVEEEFDLSDIMGEQLDAQLGTKEDRLRQLAEQVCSSSYSRAQTCCLLLLRHDLCQDSPHVTFPRLIITANTPSSIK